MKKLLEISFLIFALFVVSEACAATQQVSLLLDSAPSGNGSYNDICANGLKLVREKYHTTLMTKIYAPDNTQSDPREILLDAAKNSAFVVIAGYIYPTYLPEAVSAAPNARFLVANGDADKLTGVTRVTFRDEEGAFLAGALAALATNQSDFLKINDRRAAGIVLGVKAAAMERFEKGFRAGVRYIDKNKNTFCDYTGSFSDKDAAATAAAKQIGDGAGVIFVAAGSAGEGVITLAKSDQNFWVIGVDSEQESVNGDVVLTSMVKRTDKVILNMTDAFMNGTLKDDDVSVGLAEEAVVLSTWSDAAQQNIPLAIRAQLDDISKKIQNGEITINGTSSSGCNVGVGAFALFAAVSAVVLIKHRNK